MLRPRACRHGMERAPDTALRDREDLQRKLGRNMLMLDDMRTNPSRVPFRDAIMRSIRLRRVEGIQRRLEEQ